MTRIQWYPGHMEKARRDMQESLKVIDVVIEIRDARIPEASANPVLDTLAGTKPRLIILAKADLADPDETDLWIKHFSRENQFAEALDLQHDHEIAKIVVRDILELAKEKRAKQKMRGIRPRAVRAMACGIPNVGKSTLINRIAGKNIARTADHPGVTKNLAWIHADPQVDLLDTPGVLWPKFDNEETGMLLATVGSINDSILDLIGIAKAAMKTVSNHYPDALKENYDILPGCTPSQMLDSVAAARNLKSADGRLDHQRAAITFLQELRKGKLGRITLEKVNADQRKEMP